MLYDPHVVDVDVWLLRFRHHHRLIPEAEAIDAVIALSNCEERFAVYALDSCNQVEFSIQLDGTRIKYAVDAEAFGEIWIRGRVEIVFPNERRMLRG
ncbi:hypothetical protein D3C74_304360 [compost metagenome]